MRIVVALGGNAMTGPDGAAGPDDQRAAVAVAATALADLVVAGHALLLTHGNGPQVGNLLVKNELAAAVVPPVPLDWCGAQTQATIGLLLLDELDAALARLGSSTRTAALVSRTLVDADDPAFADPVKPVGRYVGAAEAALLTDHGESYVEVPGRGFRRVVASPEPRACLDAAAADILLAAGYVVVASGGGGIPTVRRADGSYAGVEAVVDKDLTAALVAGHVGADLLVLATDVEAVVTGWGTDDAAPVGEVTASQMRRTAAAEGFAGGSMGPKVEGVTRFAEHGGTGVVCALASITDAVAGRAGTRVVPDPT